MCYGGCSHTGLSFPLYCAGRTDMFWDQGAYNNTALDAQCLARFNATARPDWAVREYGGFRGADAASNIIFSNGELDPWITGARRSTTFCICLRAKLIGVKRGPACIAAMRQNHKHMRIETSACTLL